MKVRSDIYRKVDREDVNETLDNLTYRESLLLRRCIGEAVVRTSWLAEMMLEMDVDAPNITSALLKMGYQHTYLEPEGDDNVMPEPALVFKPSNLGDEVAAWYQENAVRNGMAYNRILNAAFVTLNNADLRSAEEVKKALYAATLGEFVVIKELPEIFLHIPIDNDFGAGEIILCVVVKEDKTHIVVSINDKRLDYRSSATSELD